MNLCTVRPARALASLLVCAFALPALAQGPIPAWLRGPASAARFNPNLTQYDATNALLAMAHAADAELKARGTVMGIAGRPVQVSNHSAAGATVSDGPYLHSELPVAGFAILEAESLEAAIALVANSPCAVAGGVVEVWPLGEMP